MVIKKLVFFQVNLKDFLAILNRKYLRQICMKDT